MQLKSKCTTASTNTLLIIFCLENLSDSASSCDLAALILAFTLSNCKKKVNTGQLYHHKLHVQDKNTAIFE